MKSRKQFWIAVVCLLSVGVITISLKSRFAVHAATAAQSGRATIVKPVPLSNAALRTVLAPPAMMLDDDAQRVTGTQARRTIFPPVQEFTLTPPNPAAGLTRTVLSVRFPQAQAAALPSSIPMTLAGQNVMLQRSPDAPDMFLTALNFNWQLFAEEQAARKAAANSGKMVPIFEGRKYRGIEKMQFVDPEEIQEAVESHQPLTFGSHALTGSAGFNVFPDHQLIMNDLHVVEDVGNGTSQHPARTFDQCIPSGPQGNPNGAWTFNTLMTAIACSANGNCTTPQNSQQIAENMLLGMLNNFSQDQLVNNNSFKVFARPNIGQLVGFQGGQGSGLLKNWPVDSNAGNSCTFNGLSSPCPSLPSAPIRLDAIVNRIDLEANGAPFPPAGELRFVFSITASTVGSGACTNGGTRRETFNIILEYNVPSTFSTLSWAQQWANLPDLNASQTFSENYLSALQNNITNAVVLKNACGGASCISQVRTNEFLIASGVNVPFWEQREFHLNNVGGAPVLAEAMIAQTPDPQFNNKNATPSGQPPCNLVNDPITGQGPCVPQTVGEYINSVAGNSQFQQTQGAAPPVPQNFNSSAFLGGSALNTDPTAPSFWNDIGITNETARIDFSFNTCNGCHGKETQTVFTHVNNRLAGAPSGLSNFLLGNQTSQCAIQTENLGSGSTSTCRESVSDPVNGTITTLFGDVARRVLFLQGVCGNSPTCQQGPSNQLLFPFINNPIGVH